MNRVFPKPGAVFFEFQLFPTRFFANEIVVFTGFFADEKHRFRFLFTFFTGHFFELDKTPPAPHLQSAHASSTRVNSPHYNRPHKIRNGGDVIEIDSFCFHALLRLPPGGLQSPWERRLPACAKVSEWSLHPAQVGCLRTHWQAGSLRSQEKSDFAILLRLPLVDFTL